MKTQKIQTVVRACRGSIQLGEKAYFGERAIICEKAFYEVTKYPFKLRRGDTIEITFTPHRGGRFFVDDGGWIYRSRRSGGLFDAAPIKPLGFDLPKGRYFRGQFRVRLVNRKQEFYHD